MCVRGFYRKSIDTFNFVCCLRTHYKTYLDTYITTEYAWSLNLTEVLGIGKATAWDTLSEYISTIDNNDQNSCICFEVQ